MERKLHKGWNTRKWGSLGAIPFTGYTILTYDVSSLSQCSSLLTLYSSLDLIMDSIYRSRIQATAFPCNQRTAP